MLSTEADAGAARPVDGASPRTRAASALPTTNDFHTTTVRCGDIVPSLRGWVTAVSETWTSTGSLLAGGRERPRLQHVEPLQVALPYGNRRNQSIGRFTDAAAGTTAPDPRPGPPSRRRAAPRRAP